MIGRMIPRERCATCAGAREYDIGFGLVECEACDATGYSPFVPTRVYTTDGVNTYEQQSEMV